MLNIKQYLSSKNIHIVKREELPVLSRIGIRVLSILFAFIVCSIFLLISYKTSPISFIASLFNGVFGTEKRRWGFLFEIAILLGFSIALVPAFKMKYWNCGADGQALVGALTCAGCMFYLGGKVPNGVLIIISLSLSIIMGMIWAVIPAIFKALFNTNETLFTLMMNYIAIQFVLFFIKTWVTGGTGKLSPMTYGRLPMIINKYTMPIIIVAVITIIIAIYLKHTKHGFELSLVGESFNTAKYAGINVKWVIIRTMLLSGAIAGLIGFILVAGYDFTVSDTTTKGRGFTGIIICWMAGMNPIYMVLSTVFVVFLECGTAQLVTDLDITSSAIQDIFIGLFFFFIIGCEFFIRYKIIFGEKNEKKIVEEHSLENADEYKLKEKNDEAYQVNVEVKEEV